MQGAGFGPSRGIGVIRCKPVRNAGNSRCRLSGFDRLGGVQLVQAATRMGFQIGQRFVFGHQIGQHPGQQGMLVNIGQIPGMIDMLVRQHGLA